MGSLARYLTDFWQSLGLENTFRLHFQEEDVVAIEECSDSDTQLVEADEQLSGAYEWAERHTKREQFKISCVRSNICSWLRKEFLEHRSLIANQTFTDNDVPSTWYNAETFGLFPRLTRLERLFLIVAASSVSQELQLSELERRSSGLQNRLKIETIDRYSVVPWFPAAMLMCN